MKTSRSDRRVLVKAPPREDGQLSIVEVTPRRCVLSDGVEVFVRWDQLQALVEQLCEERAAVLARTWWAADHGDELIEVHRIDGDLSIRFVAPASGRSDAF